jgi:fibronectin-binding autotransporter adhesin
MVCIQHFDLAFHASPISFNEGLLMTTLHRFAQFAAVAIGLVILGGSPTAHAALKTWLSTADGSDVTIPTNWDPSAPTSADEARFTEVGPTTVTIPAGGWNPLIIGFSHSPATASNTLGVIPDYTFDGTGTITVASNGNIDTYLGQTGTVTFNNTGGIDLTRAATLYAASDTSGTSDLVIGADTPIRFGLGTGTGNAITLHAIGGNLTINSSGGVDFSASGRARSLNIDVNTGKTITLTNGLVPTTNLPRVNVNGQTGGKMILGDSTTWAGTFVINNSDVEINSNTSLGSSDPASWGFIASGPNNSTNNGLATGTLVLTNNLTDMGEFFYVGSRVSTEHAQIKSKSGDNTLSGTIQADDIANTTQHYYSLQSDGTAVGDIMRISGSIATSPAVDLGGASILSLQGAGPGSVTGSIVEQNSNIWSIEKNGAGTWTLSGASMFYSGATTVNQGTLAISGSGWAANSAAITVKGGATLDLSGLPGGSYTLGFLQTLQGAGTVIGDISTGFGNTVVPGDSVGTLHITGGLTLNGGETLQYELSNNSLGANDKIVASGSLTAFGTTTVNVAPVNGYLSSGSYRLIDYTGPAISDPNAVFSLSGLISPRQSLSFSSVANQVNLDVTGSVGNLTWVGGMSSNAWDVGTTVNWTGEADSHFYNGDLVTFSDSGSNSPDINVTGDVSPGSATFTNSSGHDYALIGGSIAVGGDLTASGSGNVTFSNANVTVGGDFNATGSGNVNINNSDFAVAGGFSLNGTGKVTIANTGALSLPATIALNSGTLALNRVDDITVSNALTGAGALRKEGTNTVIVDGDNSAFTGSITVAAGTLRVDGANAMGDPTGTVTVEDGATLDVWNSATNASGREVTITGTGAGGIGALVSTQASVTDAGHVNRLVLAGDSKIAAISSTIRGDLFIDGPGAYIHGNGHNLSVVVDNGSTATTAEVNWVNVGDTNLNNIDVSGSGTFWISGDTTFGPTSGTLTLQDHAQIGFSGTLNGSDASTGLIDKPIDVANTASGGGINVYRGAKTIDSPVTMDGNLSLSMLNRDDNTTTSATLTGKLTGNGALAVHTDANATASRLGLVELTNDNNDYLGGTTIGGGGGLYGPGAVAARDRITLSIGNGGATGSIGPGDVIIDPAGNGNANLRFNRTGAYTIANTVYGSGNIEAVADGVVTLTGANSYTGTTAVSAGTLLVNGSHYGGGAYTVGTGGTLGGTGTIGSQIVVNADGILAPGASVGTLAVVGDVSIDGTLGIEVSGTDIDLLNIAGGLTLGDASVLDIQGDLATAVTHVIATYNPESLVGAFADALDATMHGYNVVYDNAGGQIILDELDGDANHDGIVNIFDINLVSANWDPTGPVGAFAPGNINHDTAVNIFDINLISANWNHVATNGGVAHAQPVPEPSSLAIALLGMLGLAAYARRRPR